MLSKFLVLVSAVMATKIKTSGWVNSPSDNGIIFADDRYNMENKEGYIDLDAVEDTSEIANPVRFDDETNDAIEVEKADDEADPEGRGFTEGTRKMKIHESVREAIEGEENW